jgi:hypothetical protein
LQSKSQLLGKRQQGNTYTHTHMRKGSRKGRTKRLGRRRKERKDATERERERGRSKGGRREEEKKEKIEGANDPLITDKNTQTSTSLVSSPPPFSFFGSRLFHPSTHLRTNNHAHISSSFLHTFSSLIN